MKAPIILGSLLFVTGAHGAVIQLDNRTGAAADHSTFSGAHSAANPGDTIYAYPSGTSYGNATITKQITLVGPGRHPNMSNGQAAMFEDIELRNGSSGTIIIGICVDEVEVFAGHSANNILISNCLFITHFGIGVSLSFGQTANNWIIEDNVFIENSFCGGCNVIDLSSTSGQSENWIIRNNVFQQLSTNNNQVFQYATASTAIINNLFILNNDDGVFEDCNGALVQDNIFWANDSTLTDLLFECTGCSFSNNLTWSVNGTLDPLTGASNLNNTNPMLNTLVTPDAYWDVNNDYALNPASAGYAASSDGTQIGLYGTGHDFVNEGYPKNWPRIHQVTPTVVNVSIGSDVTINFKAFKAGL